MNGKKPLRMINLFTLDLASNFLSPGLKRGPGEKHALTIFEIGSKANPTRHRRVVGNNPDQTFRPELLELLMGDATQ